MVELLKKHEVAVVRAMADKYGFDPVEAMACLPRGDEGPVTKTKPPTKKALAAEVAAEKKAARDAKKAAKASKPKRPPTGYLLFCKSERESVNLCMDSTATPQEKIRELARRWKENLSEDERAEWKAFAKNPSDVDESDTELEENSPWTNIGEQ
jgi:hypothetical protein